MKQKKGYGFTLLELMIVLALLGILAALAMPSYRSFMDRQQVRSALNEWQNSYYFAQREAMRQKAPVTLCGSADGLTCGAPRSNFSQGWIVIDSNNSLLQTVMLSEPRMNIFINNNQFRGEGLVFLSTGRIRNNAAGRLIVAINRKVGGAVSQQIDLNINVAGRLVGVRR